MIKYRSSEYTKIRVRMVQEWADKKGQWEGCQLEIEKWFSRDEFKATWDEHGPYFDKSFFEHFSYNIPNVSVTS